MGREFWDIFLAEQLSTTPWDVRRNITGWDLIRLGMINESRSGATKRKNALDKAKGAAKAITNTNVSSRAPVARRHR